jgi:BlaI family transcriptional regulator, penicillinase repressor
MTPPSDVELQVLSVLWRDGPSTARQVLGALPDGKQRAYTTVLTTMQNMERKGLLTHEARGNAHVYAPTRSRRQVLGPVLRGWVAKLFGGSPSAAVQHLLSESDVSPTELDEIRKFLNGLEPPPSPAPPRAAKRDRGNEK